MYAKDKSGKYKSSVPWVEAWDGGGPYVAGYCICEVREYEDGRTRVHKSKPLYLKDRPQDVEMHNIFMIASKYLRKS